MQWRIRKEDDGDYLEVFTTGGDTPDQTIAGTPGQFRYTINGDGSVRYSPAELDDPGVMLPTIDNRVFFEHPDQVKAKLAADADKMAAFGAFLQAIDDLGTTEGVTLTDMSFTGIMDTLEASSLSDTKQSKWGLKLRTLWDEVVYNYDSNMKEARKALPLAIEVIQAQ